jgi:hypothetical protein
MQYNIFHYFDGLFQFGRHGAPIAALLTTQWTKGSISYVPGTTVAREIFNMTAYNPVLTPPPSPVLHYLQKKLDLSALSELRIVVLAMDECYRYQLCGGFLPIFASNILCACMVCQKIFLVFKTARFCGSSWFFIM